MTREVVTNLDYEKAVNLLKRGDTKVNPLVKDDYSDRLLKYIPSEVVGVFLAVDSLLKTASVQVSKDILGWVVFIFLIILTPIYLHRVQKVKKYQQLAISTISFMVWVFTLGGPFMQFSWYSPIYGAILLPLYIFSVATYQAK
jgi:hypothetical protein